MPRDGPAVFFPLRRRRVDRALEGEAKGEAPDLNVFGRGDGWLSQLGLLSIDGRGEEEEEWVHERPTQARPTCWATGDAEGSGSVG